MTDETVTLADLAAQIKDDRHNRDFINRRRLLRAVQLIALMEVVRFLGALAYWWFYTPWPLL